MDERMSRDEGLRVLANDASKRMPYGCTAVQSTEVCAAGCMQECSNNTLLLHACHCHASCQFHVCMGHAGGALLLMHGPTIDSTAY
jgi:hypothetical protein